MEDGSTVSTGTGSAATDTVPVFRPSMAEFRNFSEYIAKLERDHRVHEIGLARIIPPAEWTPRRSGYSDLSSMRIKTPIVQQIEGREGIYTQINIQHRSMTVGEFEQLANSKKYATPSHADYQDLERKYWKNLTFVPALYGADVSGSVTDPDQPYWNISKLGTILDDLDSEYGMKIEGVNTPYLYFGMWKSTFAWVTPLYL